MPQSLEHWVESHALPSAASSLLSSDFRCRAAAGQPPPICPLLALRPKPLVSPLLLPFHLFALGCSFQGNDRSMETVLQHLRICKRDQYVCPAGWLSHRQATVHIKVLSTGTSPMAQWLSLYVSTAGAQVHSLARK